MNRATLCTDVERAKKFAPFNPEYLKELLDFTYNQEHTACALNMILDAMQGARTVFHHDEREVSENVRLSMQCSWTTFLLGFMRHLFAHGVVVTCLKLDPEGRVVPTLVNVENIILAQYVGEAHRSEYAVYRRKIPGDPDKKDDHDPVSTVFSSMGGFGAPQGAMMQRGDLMKNVMVFEAQDRRPLGGVICSTVSLLHKCWPNVLMAQSSALQAAGRMANPALVMQTQPDLKGTSETATGLRDNAAVQAALGGMDTHTDLAQLAQYDGRATLCVRLLCLTIHATHAFVTGTLRRSRMTMPGGCSSPARCCHRVLRPSCRPWRPSASRRMACPTPSACSCRAARHWCTS